MTKDVNSIRNSIENAVKYVDNEQHALKMEFIENNYEEGIKYMEMASQKLMTIQDSFTAAEELIVNEGTMQQDCEYQKAHKNNHIASMETPNANERMTSRMKSLADNENTGYNQAKLETRQMQEEQVGEHKTSQRVVQESSRNEIGKHKFAEDIWNVLNEELRKAFTKMSGKLIEQRDQKTNWDKNVSKKVQELEQRMVAVSKWLWQPKLKSPSPTARKASGLVPKGITAHEKAIRIQSKRSFLEQTNFLMLTPKDRFKMVKLENVAVIV